MPVSSPVVNPVEYLCVLWERPGIYLKLPKHKVMPTITIHFQDKPIRIYGLPDEPLFNQDDLSVLVPHTTKKLIPGLEIFETELGLYLNLAGVYRVLFSSLDNFGNEEYLRSIERFFVEEIEPALRKYGFPSQTVPAGVSNN